MVMGGRSLHELLHMIHCRVYVGLESCRSGFTVVAPNYQRDSVEKYCINKWVVAHANGAAAVESSALPPHCADLKILQPPL